MAFLEPVSSRSVKTCFVVVITKKLSKYQEVHRGVPSRGSRCGKFRIFDRQSVDDHSAGIVCNRERSIAGLRRVSKPGLRVYAKSTALPKVLGGLGVAIISTSSGLLTDKQANKQGVGGEVLAYVW